MQNIQELALLLNDRLELEIEQRRDINVDPLRSQQIISQSLLICLLDRLPPRLELLIVRPDRQLLEIFYMVDPATSNCLCHQTS